MDARASEEPGRTRDIDLVMVTGAGASREFGVNGVKLPLMGDWSDFLVRKLGAVGQYRQATGLRREMPGEAFEAQLGKFLKQVEAFRRVKDLLVPSVQFQDFGPATQMMGAQGVLDQWYSQAVGHFDQIIELVRESLYELFADASTDLDAAASAYGGLLHSLGIGPQESLVYATTNYDTIAEQAIRRNGGLPDWGQPPTLGNEAELPLAVPGLLKGLGRYVPVLHLHGRVGWYRRDGRVYATNITRHQQGFGIPLVMLPDPDKVYDQDDVINSLWQQFAEALSRAKRVLVLGHSLNDSFLLRALIQHVQPFERIAVTVLEDERNQGHPLDPADPVFAKVSQNLVNAAIILMRFGSSPDAEIIGLRKWQDGLAENGLL
jgi:hypothetical protein